MRDFFFAFLLSFLSLSFGSLLSVPFQPIVAVADENDDKPQEPQPYTGKVRFVHVVTDTGIFTCILVKSSLDCVPGMLLPEPEEPRPTDIDPNGLIE